jgi:hypothetical protein
MRAGMLKAGSAKPYMARTDVRLSRMPEIETLLRIIPSFGFRTSTFG